MLSVCVVSISVPSTVVKVTFALAIPAESGGMVTVPEREFAVPFKPAS